MDNNKIIVIQYIKLVIKQQKVGFLSRKFMQKNPKVILLGDMNVGKTAIIQTLTTGVFPSKFSNTLGACFQRFQCQLEDNSTTSIDIWDTAGQEKYRSLLNIYYKNCDGIILVFNMTDLKSLESLKYWAEQIQQNCQNEPCILLVGNKYDLKDACQIIPHDKIVLFARSYNWKYIYCSAKEGYNIQRIFSDICISIKEKSSLKKIKPQPTTRIRNRKRQRKDQTCC